MIAVLCTFLISPVFAKDKSVVLKIQPETIVNTFKSLMKSEYLQKVADDFALKAAEQFIKQINEEQESANGRSGKSISLLETPTAKLVQDPSLLEQISVDISGNMSENDVQESKQSDEVSEDKQNEHLLALINSPPPDGDNLEKESLLTDIEEKKVIEPQGQIYKINGKHFRKYDLYWK